MVLPLSVGFGLCIDGVGLFDRIVSVSLWVIGMAKGGKVAKTASKNNPLQRKKGITAKLYNGKQVKPVKYVNRDKGQVFMAAQFDDESLVKGANGVPLEWSSI
ncbi:hypothetical protein CRT38_03092 [Anaplasma phagocytophilum str. CRT38]|uniref:Uncharacterized protein n=1 Tax=Anaplasma phagocytophilum str. CRT38 TaxID=1269275 RepID=S6GB06_ANAPH|nr:hypothetical protein CRT38_03092 [Anaplasma phagocytophilum str. CRT38]